MGIILSIALFGAIVDPDIIMRGDVNHSGAVNVSDASYLSSYLYQGGPAPACANEADVNHDGQLTGSDVSYLLSWLFSGGPAPPSPGPFNTVCTSSTTPLVGCDSGC